AAFVQRLDRYLITLADLTDDVSARHPYVIKNQFAGRTGTDAKLVLLLAHTEAGEIVFHDKPGNPLVPFCWLSVGEQEIEPSLSTIGNPEFAAIQDKGVAVEPRLGDHRERIAARARLR